ncbi:prephenate dehydratase [Acinetobacter baumannii]
MIGEVELRIHHQFLVSENTRKDSIKQIYAHQQTLAQCRQWLDAHYPGVECVALNLNAEAARRIRTNGTQQRLRLILQAGMYNLEILHSNIEDNPENTTRFLVIGREKIPQSGNTNIVINFARMTAGALLEILAPFAKHNISLTSIEILLSTT